MGGFVMMRRVVGVLMGFVLLGAMSGMIAGVYHVTATGNDGASGSESAPWKSLSKANSMAVAGDLVVIHAGTYADGVHPSNSGRAGSPITFQAAAGEKVVVNASTGVQLGSSSSYIVVDGFEIHASYQVANLTGSKYITIRNCKLYGGRGNYAAFLLDNASYCVIQRNYFDRQDPDADGSGGDGIKLVSGSHHNLIESNTVIRCEHIAFVSAYSKSDVYQSYNIWRNNTGYFNHTNFSLQDGVVRCVFENNTSYYMGLVWTGGNGNCLQFTGTSCIIRFNTLYDDTATTHTARQWYSIVGSGAGSANGSTPSIEYNKIYNNTVYGESDQGWAKAGWRIDNYKTGMYNRYNVFKNNIFARATASQVDDIDATVSLGAMSNQYDGNLLCGSAGNAATVRYEYSGGNIVWRLADAIRNKPGQWLATNKEGDPLFVNTMGQGPAKDFNLRAGSPAIDAAVNLTTANGGGSGGTTLVVADANYFIDGWGIPGVEGDSIRIDNAAPVGIAKVDYATNTLTLNNPRSWVSGAKIYYFRSDRYQGNGPDMGAHEFGGASPISGAPVPPALVSPADGATQSTPSVTFNWSPVDGTTSYRLQVATDSAFTNIVLDQVGIAETNFQATGLRSGVTHHWHVAASNATGASPWSGCSRFVVSGLTDVSNESATNPLAYALHQNYPNPFNPSTLIRYSVAAPGQVSLKVFNVLGQEVASLVNEVQTSGLHEVRFDAAALPNGTYFYRLKCAGYEETKKMLLVK
jgi:hypothetical protein